MGDIYVVASGKGGSGKSTICAGTGAALARRGQHVLLIDADAGLCSLDLMLGVTDRLVYHLGDILAGRCEPVRAIHPVEACPGLEVLTAPPADHEDMTEENLTRLCRGLAHYYDFILIDAPAGIDRGLSLASAPADAALLVVTPDPICVRSAEKAAKILKEKELSCRLVINRYRRRVLKGRMVEDLDEVIDKTALQLIGVVPEDERLAVCAARGEVFGG
ncbi:MAG: septum site-determining protein MinD, partial [Clostridiales bacterium]|nr:septum site-determining protein MinD [Clostridiales bacterium]